MKRIDLIKLALPSRSRIVFTGVLLGIIGLPGLFSQPVYGALPASEPGRQPNIIVLLVDDLGYADLSIHGSRDVVTPNIDSIAKNGVRFTDGYVTAPVCTPSRGGLMTGRYQQRFGFEYNMAPGVIEHSGLDLEQQTIADLLKPAGYATGMIGKWDLGVSEPYLPRKRGFDEFYGFPGGSRPHSPTQEANVPYNAMYRNETMVDETGWSSDVYAEEAVDFIKRHQNEPFFLFVSFTAPHWPMEATPADMKAFQQVEDLHRRTFLAMMQGLDRAVGRVLNCVDGLKLSDNTVVFFLSDNGGATGPPRKTPDQEFAYGANTSRNEPFRGDKGQLYEGGIRVPFFLQWKGRVPAGTVCSTPVISLDIAATAVDISDAPAPRAKLDGENLLKVLDQSRTRASERPLYWRLGDNNRPLPWAGGNRRAVRSGDWKVVDYADRDAELYNLKNDPGEGNDLSSENPSKRKELMGMLEKWETGLESPRWSLPGG